jgi:long-chain acyl-CoA synthetase
MAPRTIEASVRWHAAATPAHPALVNAGLSLDYGQLWRCAVLVSRWLQEKGVAPGQRIALTAAEDPWFPACYLGTHLAGAIAMPMDPRLPRPVYEAVMAAADPDLVLEDEELARLGTALCAEAAAMDPSFPAAPHMPGADDIADILFTSGSTGAPKGVVLTHANIAAAAHNINAFIGNEATDREVVTVPLSHSFGLGRLRCNLMAGGTLIIVHGLTYPAQVFRSLQQNAATGLSCVPSGMAVLLKPGGKYLSAAGRHLRYVELGSAPMPETSKRMLMQLLPDTRLCMHYGLTEASRSAFIEFHADASHLDSVGRASPNVEIRICADDGDALGAGETGRICVRAATVMHGYWRDQVRTREVLDAEGWLDTGDLGRLDGDGYLHLAGRRDDLINVGGRKVYPSLVEEAFAHHADVMECACVGAPDPDGMLGEVPVIYIVPRDPSLPGVDALRELVAGKLEPHAVPRLFRFVTEIPRTASGKPLRAALRAREVGATA